MTSRIKYYPITPIPKPRMTRRDKWLNPPRPCVAQFRAFCDACRAYSVSFKPGDSIRFILPMPATWSTKKKTRMENQPHESKPDISNLLKALEDAVYPDKDEHIWRYGEMEKVWGIEGAIVVKAPRPQFHEGSPP